MNSEIQSQYKVNITSRYLDYEKLAREKAYINGRWVEGESSIDV